MPATIEKLKSCREESVKALAVYFTNLWGFGKKSVHHNFKSKQ
jgi:hypothetical protein